MALSESQRIELYEFVKRSSLGKAGADIVMNAIPDIDWNHLATHDDLALLGADLRGEMSELRADLRGEMSELRAELRGEMSELRAELRGEVSELRAELRGEMSELRGELGGEMVELRGEMVELRSDLRGEFRVGMHQLENRLQRSIVTWILAAQGLTLATISALVATLAFVLR